MKTDHSIVNNIAFPVTKTTGTDVSLYEAAKSKTTWHPAMHIQHPCS